MTRAPAYRVGLTVNEAKTSVEDARRATFDCLGYAFGPQRLRKTGHTYLAASPSRKSVQRLSPDVVFGDLGVLEMRCVHLGPRPKALR